MTPYAVQSGEVTLRQLIVLEEVVIELRDMPDDLTCHQVCARLEALFPDLEHRKGSFVRCGTHHSWLVFKGTNVILDAYPWASASGPLLITTEGAVNPWRNMYVTVEPT